MVVKLKHVRSNFNMNFNVNFNVLLSKYIVHLLVKIKKKSRYFDIMGMINIIYRHFFLYRRNSDHCLKRQIS